MDFNSVCVILTVNLPFRFTVLPTKLCCMIKFSLMSLLFWGCTYVYFSWNSTTFHYAGTTSSQPAISERAPQSSWKDSWKGRVVDATWEILTLFGGQNAPNEMALDTGIFGEQRDLAPVSPVIFRSLTAPSFVKVSVVHAGSGRINQISLGISQNTQDDANFWVNVQRYHYWKSQEIYPV